MTILDTHAWLWWLSEPDLLSDAALHRIEEAKAANALMVSAMSVWEAALLYKKGRLELRLSPGDLVTHCEGLRFLRFVPVSARVALESVVLEPFHPDPADRLIVATAIQHGATLVTKDERILASPKVTTIW